MLIVKCPLELNDRDRDDNDDDDNDLGSRSTGELEVTA
jgi:hypothetical protein